MVMMTVVLVMCMCVYVYVCGAIFNIVQYMLYALSAVYVLVTVVCVRGMHKVMNQYTAPYISDIAITFCVGLYIIYGCVNNLQHPQHNII